MKVKLRKEIYEQFGGRCAYCGSKIDFKEMQVDHILPKRLGGCDDVYNFYPSCRLCNSYKRAHKIADFRDWLLAGVINRLRKLFIFKVAERYGMIEVKDWDKTFYYEKFYLNKAKEKQKKEGCDEEF